MLYLLSSPVFLQDLFLGKEFRTLIRKEIVIIIRYSTVIEVEVYKVKCSNVLSYRKVNKSDTHKYLCNVIFASFCI